MKLVGIVLACGVLAVLPARSQSNLVFSDSANMIAAGPSPNNVVLRADSYREIVIRKVKDCKLVVLADTDEEIRIGCRKELAR